MSTMTRWQPFGEFADLHERLDRLFERMTNGQGQPALPAVDVIRRDDAIVIRADMPRIKPDEVKIEVEDDVLTVSGEHKEEKEEKKEKFIRRERSYGLFSRSLPLPSGVDVEAIEATSSDGVLEVRVPLPKESRKKAVDIKPKATK